MPFDKTKGFARNLKILARSPLVKTINGLQKIYWRALTLGDLRLRRQSIGSPNIWFEISLILIVVLTNIEICKLSIHSIVLHCMSLQLIASHCVDGERITPRPICQSIELLQLSGELSPQRDNKANQFRTPLYVITTERLLRKVQLKWCCYTIVERSEKFDSQQQ